MYTIRLGVASRLVGGLSAITALAIATSLVAIFGFNRFEEGFRIVAMSQMPSLVNAAELARQSESMVANAPAIAVANSQQNRRTVAFRMDDQVMQFEDLARSLFQSGVEPHDLEQLKGFKANLITNLQRLDELVDRRLQADVTSDRMLDQIIDLNHRLRAAALSMESASSDTAPTVWLWISDAQQTVGWMLAGLATEQAPALARFRAGAAESVR
ncbi:MAG: hypothetical protein R3245_04620, partial [Kiloniellales bacterium]|nr:hypothetical protein [Kiloniellales bacterium]